MSLCIDIDHVSRVLLADGWHKVAESSFLLDAYEYVEGDDIVHGGGNSGICSTGFAFRTLAGETFFGPLSAVLAVSTTLVARTERLVAS